MGVAVNDPIADIRVWSYDNSISTLLNLHAGAEARVSPKDQIAHCIRTALESCEVVVSSVTVTHFMRESFGNHVAHAETIAGPIRIVFDRRYELNLQKSSIAQDREPEIVAALAREFSAAIRAGL